MNCRLVRTAINRLGGTQKVAELIPKVISRVDSFPVDPLHRRIFWGWRASPCGGLRDNMWKRSNGAAMGTTLSHEVERLSAIGMLHAGGVAIDIGSHMGDSTIPMSLLANMTVAFEPNPITFANMAANAKLNSDLNIHVHNVGIAPTAGTIPFSYGGTELCNGGVSGMGGKGNGPQQVVQLPVEPLQSFLVRHYGKSVLPHIRYIKMDAEGFDAHILESILPIVRIICESGSCPTLQVEWFDGFVQPSKPNAISEGSRNLFRALEKLPHGPWELLCTRQINSGAGERTDKLVPIQSQQNKHHCSDIIARKSTSA